MVERFNGRVATEMLQVCVASHEDLEILLRGFRFAYNQRMQRVPNGLSPVEYITSWLEENPRARNPDYVKPDNRDIMKHVDKILEYANDVSQPDKRCDRICLSCVTSLSALRTCFRLDGAFCIDVRWKAEGSKALWL